MDILSCLRSFTLIYGQRILIANDFLYFYIIDKEIDMPLAYDLQRGRQKQNDQLRFDALFETFRKLKIILFTILLLFTKSPPNFWV